MVLYWRFKAGMCLIHLIEERGLSGADRAITTECKSTVDLLEQDATLLSNQI